MDEDQMTTSEPMGRLEGKIDALAEAVNAGFASVDKRLTHVETRLTKVETGLTQVETRLTSVETRLTKVETRLTSVETGLTKVETRLTDVERRLVNVEIVAGETKTFSRNVWDSVTSLTQKVEQGFEDAKKERKEGFDLVHKAIRHWGGRVDTLETARTRTTKRRP